MNIPSEQVSKAVIDGGVAIGGVAVWWQYTMHAAEAVILFGGVAIVVLRFLIVRMEYRKARRNESKGE